MKDKANWTLEERAVLLALEGRFGEISGKSCNSYNGIAREIIEVIEKSGYLPTHFKDFVDENITKVLDAGENYPAYIKGRLGDMMNMIYKQLYPK